ncbi:hypothetical protein ACKWTF_014569 [Chironomus riparius]
MFGFTTSFLLELFIVMLLYQTDCLGLFKLYTCATIVAYYMFASFMLVKEIFCDKTHSIVKHFLVIDIIATCTVISGNIKFYEFYPNWLPFFIVDTLIRLYSDFCMFSLLVKYKNNCSNEKQQQSTVIDKSASTLTATKSSSTSSSATRSSSSTAAEGVMKIFDNFCGFFPLEMSGYIYCGFNFVFSVVVIVLLLIFGELSEEKVVIYAIIFTINAVMLLALIAGIKMRKSSIFIPILIFTFIEIFTATYLLVSSMIVIIQGEDYEVRMKRFIEKINIPETAGIGIWIYFYLCICSLYDVIKCEENERRLLVAKESITYGSVSDVKGSSSL